MQKQVDISQKDWDTVISYAHLAYEKHKSEIAGMLLLVNTDDGLLLKDPVILKQEVTAGNCWLNKDALAEYYSKMAVKHGPSNIKFVWWHSHHTMGAFWSGTDQEAMKEYAGGDWSISLVVNLKEEYKLTIKYWNPFEASEDLKLNILSKKPRIDKKVKDQFNKLVEPRTLVEYKPRNNFIYSNDRYNQLSFINDINNDDTVYDKYFDELENIVNNCWMNSKKYNHFSSQVDDLAREAIKEGVVITTIPKKVYDKLDINNGEVSVDEYISINYETQLEISAFDDIPI